MAAEAFERAAEALRAGDDAAFEELEARGGLHLEEAAKALEGAKAAARKEALAAVPAAERGLLERYLDAVEGGLRMGGEVMGPVMPSLKGAADMLATVRGAVERYQRTGSVLGALKEKAAEIQQSASRAEDAVRRYADPGQALVELKPGETLTYGVEGGFSNKAGGLSGKDKISLEAKQEGGYKVTLETGGKAEAGPDALNVNLGGGLKVELEATAPEEAKRLARAVVLAANLRKQGTLGVVGSAAALEGYGDASKHITAVELGNAAGLSASASLPAAEIGLSGEAATSARVSFKEGKADELTIKRAYKLEGTLDAKLEGTRNATRPVMLSIKSAEDKHAVSITATVE